MQITVLERDTLPTKILEGLDRLGRVLDDDLAQLADFDIHAVWRFRPASNKIVLELTPKNEHGETETLTADYPIVLLDETEKRIRSAFTGQILSLTKVLSRWNRDELRAQRARMAAYEPLVAD